jgi:polyferredoxin
VKKLHIPTLPDQILRKLKYLILAVFVILLPMLAVDLYGLSAPWFCKWICPAGTLEGGLPLVASNASLRANLGFMFWWKVALLGVTVIASLVIYRPFCKYICPLGAFYALFNKWSLVRMEVDESSCVHCKKCMVSCPMQVDVLKNINSAECIRCGKCAQVCPTGAIDLKFGKITVRKNEI